MKYWTKLLLSALSAYSLANQGALAADPWPSKPVKIVVPFSAGSATDILARTIAEDLRSAFNQAFIVDNKPGASAQIGTSAVAQSPADGYTLLFTTNTSHSANPHLFKKLPYDPIKDFTPVARICYIPVQLAVGSEQPIKSVKELIEYARANKNSVSYGYGSSISQIAAAAFVYRSKIDALPIPYKSSPSVLTDLISNRVTFTFVDLASAQAFLKDGRIRLLANSAKAKMSALSDLPSLADAAGLPDFDLTAWIGLFGPANLQPDTVKRLNHVVNNALQTRKVRDRLSSVGAEAAPGTPEEFDHFVKAQLAVWKQNVKDAGIQPE